MNNDGVWILEDSRDFLPSVFTWDALYVELEDMKSAMDKPILTMIDGILQET
jgi:hypothetical protein